jgi:flagellar basal-body rod modification protein FlgD
MSTSTNPPALGSVTDTKTAQAPPVNPMGQLGKNDFLKLMVAQLQHQDPTNPMDDKEFMGQLAQFSTLEQITNMSQGLDQLSFSSQISQSIALIGHTIDYVRADGSTASGVAESTSVQDGKILIKVGSDEIAPADVTNVGGASTSSIDDALAGIQDTLSTIAANTAGSGSPAA